MIEPFSVSSHSVIKNELEVLGVRAMTRRDIADVITWVEAKRIVPVVDEVLPLDKVNEAYDRLRSGNVLGRLVLEP